MIHKHHRKLRRSKDERPVNLIGLPDVIHDWVHANPEKAREAGLIVSQHDDPADIMVTIPEEALKKVSPLKGRKREAKRNRATIQFRVPKDDIEDGAGVFDDLFEQCAEVLSSDSEGVATQGEKSRHYNVLLAVMYDFITARKGAKK